MPNTKELYLVTVSSPIYKTVGDYINDKTSPASGYSTNPDGFLNIVGEDGLTNRQRLENVLNKYPDTRKYIGKTANELPLKLGINFYLEYEVVNSQSFLTEGLEVVSYDTIAFKAAQLAKLEADKGYQAINKPVSGEDLNGVLREDYPDVTVWIWCRSLSPKNDAGNELTGQFFDLTPFIQNLRMANGKNGGNFNFTLPPLQCEIDKNTGYWVLKSGTVTQFRNENDRNLNKLGYVAESSLLDQNLQRNEFLFKNMIKSNDLVFIRLETLDLEKDQRYKDANSYIIDKNQIADRIYDMIGLIDYVTETYSSESNDLSTKILGRDLSKLFIEDGTYFYGLENANGQLKFSGQSQFKNTQLQRIFGDGALNFLALYQFTSIEYILKFIVDQLSNIKVVPNSLFDSYNKNGNDRRNKKFNVVYKFDKQKNNTEYTPEVKEELASGIWQIVKLVIDESVTGRMIHDTSFSTAQGSLLNFINTACATPFVEFFMNTYGDQFHLIVRKPPYDRKSIVSTLDGIVSTEEGIPSTPPSIIDVESWDVLETDLSMNDQEAYSWYSFYPKSYFGDSSASLSLQYLGALYFEEYAQTFGSRPYQQVHPYLPYVHTNNNEKGMSLYEMQAVEDYKYLIECTQYLPFTRSGRLLLNRDRRIKIGNFIRLKSTGEIFHVDAVQHTHNITDSVVDATTLVEVSRGMVEQFIYGIHMNADDESNKKIYVSYFNLINTELELNTYKDITETVSEKTPIKRSVGIDSFREGFGEYMIHQQGLRGATQIAQAVKTGSNTVSDDVYIHMFGNSKNVGNVGRDFVGEKTPVNFYNYWVKKYNAAYDSVNVEVFYNEELYSKAEKETGIKKVILKTWGMIESGNKQLSISSGGFIGIMQVLPDEANRFHLNISDSFENIKIGALLYKKFKLSNPFTGIGGATELVDDFTYTERKIKTKTIDRDVVFNNFKVNKYTFNFFLKNLQFQKEYRTVTSKQIYKTDQEGSLPDIILKSSRKKK